MGVDMSLLDKIFKPVGDSLFYNGIFEGNEVKLRLGVEGRLGDESCTVWKFKVLVGKVKPVRIRYTGNYRLIPITNKVVLSYFQKGGPGSWFSQGKILVKYKLVLHKDFQSEKKVIVLT